MSRQQRLSLVVTGAILAIAALLVLEGIPWVPERAFQRKLADLLPTAADVPGWQVTKRSVAETREMRQAVSELLNYEEGFLIDFTSGDRRISLYAAYWPPGRMSHRVIAGHTPDVCWVEAGWGNQLRELKTVQVALENSAVLPMEHRIFHIRDQVEHVVFVHLVGGSPMNYGTGWKPPWYALFSDIVRKGLRQREEQFFVRISSNRPFEEFQEALPVKIFLRRLAAVFPGKAGE